MTGVLDQARCLAEDVLWPESARVDQHGRIPPSHFEALAGGGLFDLTHVPPGEARLVHEALAGGCGATTFVWAQHHTPVRTLARSPNTELKDRWLGDMKAGSVLSGVAFAHLRRPGPPALLARADGDSLIVDGHAPWLTSWGLARFFLVGARLGPEADDQVVWFWLDGHPSDDVAPSPVMDLVAMRASRTVSLTLVGHRVEPERVVLVEPFEDWARRDALAAAQPSAGALGLAARAVRLLGQAGDHDGGGAIRRAAERLGEELNRCRSQSYQSADAVPAGAQSIPDLLAHRAWGLDVARRTAMALVSAIGGRAMASDQPAQRLAREAMFYTVQAQTALSRIDTLDLLSRPLRSA